MSTSSRLTHLRVFENDVQVFEGPMDDFKGEFLGEVWASSDREYLEVTCDEVGPKKDA